MNYKDISKARKILRKKMGIFPLRLFKKNKATSKFADNTLSKFVIVGTVENTKVSQSNWLMQHAYNVTSERGEDGIIEKIFEMIPNGNKWICEFGAFDGKHMSNVWNLLKNKKGYKAVLIEPSEGLFAGLKKEYADMPDIYCIKRFVNFDGDDRIDNILKDTPIPCDMDMMIIDIDGADYHIWDAIQDYHPKIVSIEFSATIPNDVVFAQPRDMSIRQGSSLAAAVELGKKKGYELIGVVPWNAFFAKKEIAHLFNVTDNSPQEMYRTPAGPPSILRAFQLYDGTIRITHPELLWHRVDFDINDCQVLPKTSRRFSRKLAVCNKVLDEKGFYDFDLSKYEKILENKSGNGLYKNRKNIFSESGEDGILEKIIEIIGCQNRQFVDIGSGDGKALSRTYNLLCNKGWSGISWESDKKNLVELRQNYVNHDKNISVIDEDVNLLKEGVVDNLINKSGLQSDFDFLAINIYGAEYQVWKNITKYRPKIVSIQFNPTIQNDVFYIQDDDQNLHQGCSLQALITLGKDKSYQLVATSFGSAFFVDQRYYNKFEIESNDIDSMFESLDMKMFQLYDGTLKIGGFDEMLWHKIKIDQDSIQVLPKALRQHQYYTEIGSMPQGKFFYKQHDKDCEI